MTARGRGPCSEGRPGAGDVTSGHLPFSLTSQPRPVRAPVPKCRRGGRGVCPVPASRSCPEDLGPGYQAHACLLSALDTWVSGWPTPSGSSVLGLTGAAVPPASSCTEPWVQEPILPMPKALQPEPEVAWTRPPGHGTHMASRALSYWLFNLCCFHVFYRCIPTGGRPGWSRTICVLRAGWRGQAGG